LQWCFNRLIPLTSQTSSPAEHRPRIRAVCDGSCALRFLLVVGLLSLWTHLHLVNFQRAMIFMQSRVYLYVLPFMRSYCFSVLDRIR
jgi:hypothetical protein